MRTQDAPKQCPFHFGAAKAQKAPAPKPEPKLEPQETFQKSPTGCPFHRMAQKFGPSMPIVDGKVQVPSVGTVLKRLFVPTKPAALPALKREEIGLSPMGPKGELVGPGNQWPNETVHPLYPEFRALSGVEKAESIAHFSHASRRVGKLDPLGEHGLTANPQIIVDPSGMRWPFEADAQLAAARPREKNMHGRGAWGEISITPNPDPAKRVPYGVLGKGGVGDFRMSLGADQTSNVVGGALGIPLSPNEQGVESANFLMLAGPGPQLDDLDYFARPLSTVALPDQTTPTQFKILDHLFKASAESGVRPGNHMFNYDQDGNFDPTVEIPAQVNLVPNPNLTMHKLASIQSQAIDGVGGEAVREKFSNLQGQIAGQPVRVLDLALSEALVANQPGLNKNDVLSLQIADADGVMQNVQSKVVSVGEAGTKLQFQKMNAEAKMAVYQSMDLSWELGRRVQPGQDLYSIDVKMESGEWKRDVASVQAKSDFFPSEFADHQRLYAHTERPNKTPILRKMLKGIRWATGNVAEMLASFSAHH